LLEFKLSPRIRDLSDSQLFTIDKTCKYPKLEAILRGQINTKVIRENYEDVLRPAHSIREETASASLIEGKLGAYAYSSQKKLSYKENGLIVVNSHFADRTQYSKTIMPPYKLYSKNQPINPLASFFSCYPDCEKRRNHNSCKKYGQ